MIYLISFLAGANVQRVYDTWGTDKAYSVEFALAVVLTITMLVDIWLKRRESQARLVQEQILQDRLAFFQNRWGYKEKGGQQ